MAGDLNGRKIAIVAAEGVEEVELVKPREAVENAGAETELLSIEEGEIQSVNGDLNKSGTYPVDKLVADASVDDYDGVILPGGVLNPDKLRVEESVIGFLRACFETGKPVGVICHGPWTLVEADLVRDRKITSYPSVKTDILNAGGNWVDEEVVVDEGLVSSRKPDDLPAFCDKIVEELAEGAHDVHPEGATAS